MKTKNLVIIALVVGILLGYNIFCYKLINNIVIKDTKVTISNYLKTDDKIKYLKIIYKNNNYNIYIKDKDNYYHFILDNNYKIIDVKQKVPLYIR